MSASATAAAGRLARRRSAVAAALVVAAGTTVITGCAHSVGGGAAPDPLLLATAFVITLLALAPVLGARRSARGGTARQLTAVVLAQLVQHVLYALPERAAGAATHVHGAHAHAGGAELHAPAIVHEHASMPLAHVAAGLVTLSLLRAAPLAVDAMIAAMSPRLAEAVLEGTCPPARRRASVTAARPPQRRALDALHAALVTRGPPLAAA